MIVLISKSGVGKSTVEKELVKIGYKETISITTREKRDNEIDGIDYEFVDEDTFNKYRNKGKLAECIKVYDNWYGLKVNECKDDAVFVCGVDGLKQIVSVSKKYKLNIMSFYLYVNEDTLRSRMELRGDTKEQIDKRIRCDDMLFKDVDSIIDCMVFNGKSAKETARFISDTYKRFM